MTRIVHNVTDRRRGWIGSWEVDTLDYDALTDADKGRTVIYVASDGRAEAGTLSSWGHGMIYARYTSGSTAAATPALATMFGIRRADNHPNAPAD